MFNRYISSMRWKFATAAVPRLGAPDSRSAYLSQHGQDAYVAGLFPDRPGFFVDIGANDGTTLSNTHYLEKHLGWTGIAFEPHPDVFAKLVAARGCETINACVGLGSGTCRFSCVDVGHAMLSGVTRHFTRSHARRIKRLTARHGVAVREIDVPVVAFNDVLGERGRSVVDYLSLDTEGGELAILQTIDFTRFTVRCISVENNERSLALRKYLTAFGFDLVAVGGCDEIYVHGSVPPGMRLAS